MRRFLLFLFIVFFPVVAQAAPVKDAHTAVELIAPEQSIAPGRPFLVGLSMVMDDQWHTY